jgi:hypothetical protein
VRLSNVLFSNNLEEIMKHLFFLLSFCLSTLYAGEMAKLDRETAKKIVMEAMQYKREI